MITPLYTNPKWTISSILSESWRKVAGYKANYFIALVLYQAIFSFTQNIISFCGTLLFSWYLTGSASTILLILSGVLIAALSIAMIPLGVGLGLMGIRRAANKPITPTIIFEPYRHALPLIMMGFLVSILVTAGYLLFILPGIYLTVAYSFAPYLIVEKNMGVWQALEQSRQAITQYWWRYFGLSWVNLFLWVAGVMSCFIGLIWLLPLITIVVGEVFAKTFKEEPASPMRDLTVDP